MQRLSFIRNLLTGFLVLVFALGITPKRTLHNLIASHTDGRQEALCKLPHDQTQLSKAVFNCQCDNLVVESPFVPELMTVSLAPVSHTLQHQPGKVQESATPSVMSFRLRGPPALS